MYWFCSMFLGMLISIVFGWLEVVMWKVLVSICGMLLLEWIRKLCLVIGIVMFEMLVFWKVLVLISFCLI